jgi:Flp pilus assembly protein TadD
VFWPPLDPGGLYLALVNRTGRDRLARRPPADVEALIALAESQGSADLYQRALKAAPTSLAASRGLARLRYPDEGILEKAVKAHPADPFLLTLRGEALRQAGKLDNAERTLRAAIDADPDQVEPYINLGVLCATQGRGAEAIKLFESALAIDPLNQAAILNLRRARGR